jgi:hypothetical protein
MLTKNLCSFVRVFCCFCFVIVLTVVTVVVVEGGGGGFSMFKRVVLVIEYARHSLSFLSFCFICALDTNTININLSLVLSR